MNANVSDSPVLNQSRSEATGPARFCAWHVGRSGDFACGMAQVINTYQSWRFDDFETKAIQSWGLGKGIKGLGLFLSAAIKVFKLSNPEHNLLVVHFSHKGSFVREGLLLWLAKLRGFAVTAHIHGSQFVPYAHKWPKLTQFVLSRANEIVVLSEATLNSLKTLLPAANIQLIPNAVAHGNIEKKQPWAVFGGGVTERKGVDVLLQAWHNVAAHSHWTLYVAGPISTEFQQKLTENVWPVSENVKFLGAVPHKELLSLLNQSAVAVLPSRDEAMPMFILEALARENCVISTYVGGIPAVLEGGKGELAEPGDVNALANCLCKVISDEGYREALAKAGYRHYAELYSAEAVFSRLEVTWKRALESER